MQDNLTASLRRDLVADSIFTWDKWLVYNGNGQQPPAQDQGNGQQNFQELWDQERLKTQQLEIQVEQLKKQIEQSTTVTCFGKIWDNVRKPTFSGSVESVMQKNKKTLSE
eukprot:c9439_g1_i1.p1 GENE.c9439_g1_i1~~c9439_g1_i1.p1  ORF type:complete len:110 (-),score=23.60 c9439_g1_i1:62-391(-)